jgi:hypothetical protein
LALAQVHLVLRTTTAKDRTVHQSSTFRKKKRYEWFAKLIGPIKLQQPIVKQNVIQKERATG